jgi:hypothetical protein
MSLKIAFSDAVLLMELLLKMDTFLEADFLMETPQRSWSYSALWQRQRRRASLTASDRKRRRS